MTLGALVVVFLFTGFLNYPKAWNVMAGAARSAHLGISDYWDVPFRLGLDLKGGANLIYEADLSKIPSKDQTEALLGTRDVIERRVNAFGVAEPLVETASAGGVSRINVELAGVSDVESAIKQIGETPVLEFKTPKSPDAQIDKKATDEANAASLKKAEAALDRVKVKREVFATVAKEVSEDAATKEKGGETVFVNKMTAAYSEVVQEITSQNAWKGELMPKLIETKDAYWIVKVDDIRRTEREVQASHILICFKGASNCDKETTKEEAYAKIKALVPQLTPANFAKFASENSTEPGAVNSGGSLGWFFPVTMVDSFATAVRPMYVNTITKEPVLTDFGYHLILKSGSRPNVILPEYKLSVIKIAKTAGIINASDPWENTNLSGKDLESATVQFDSRTGEPQVSLKFSAEGGKKFAELTKAWVGKQIAIFLDGKEISAPVVQQEIDGGSAQITGNFSIETAKTLARRLNAGALPVPIKLVSQSTIGPTLGAADLEKSMKAATVAFLLVALFMILFYRLPGVISVISLLFYTSVVLAIYKLFPVTLSLSGIAGFVVTVGMAVDANVLIFERMREELRLGRSLLSAIDEGFNRAWSSIWDGNITTLFAAFVLFYFTSSVIKGFALTLAIGVIVSMFSAITVTRSILRFVSGFEFAKKEWLYGAKKK